MSFTVGKISIVSLIIYFVVYVAIHLGLGYLKQQAEKEVNEKPGNIEIENRKKWTGWAFKFWPMIAVVLIVLALYFR